MGEGKTALQDTSFNVTTYLGRSSAQSSPVKPGEHVDNHIRVDLELVLDKFGVLGVQRVRRGGTLAGLDGAGNKVEGEDLHGEGG